jgi:hypothetical protein
MGTYLETAISTNVDLGVNEGAVFLGELVGVTRVAVLVVVTVRGSAIREEDHDLMD